MNASVAGRTNEIVRKLIDGLIRSRDATPTDAAAAVGMSKATMYRRLDGTTPFTAGEVAALAAHYEHPVGDLYEGRLHVQRIPAVAA